MVNIGKKIREARKEQKITQEDLAQAIGVSDKSISAYESERISPPLRVLERIAIKTEKALAFFIDDTMESAILAKLQDVEKQFIEIKSMLDQMKRK